MKLLVILAITWVLGPLKLAAQTTVRELEVRAFLHDPVRPTAVFLAPGKGGGLLPLELAVEGLTAARKVTLTDDVLTIHGEDKSIAARVKVPLSVRRAIVLIVPAEKESAATPYRMLVLDDSAAVFPWGSSLAVSLIPVETAIEAGEHRLILRSGKVTPVPAVKKVNDFNMAQTNFLYRDGTKWITFTERQLQYVGDSRRVFLVHSTPRSTQPFVATIVDYQPFEKNP